MLKRIFLVAVMAGLLFAGCKKADEYPIEPVIEFKSLSTIKDANGFDTQFGGILEISFTDGDGDIGINDDEINQPPFVGEYVDNVHMLCYYDSSGTWVRLSAWDDKGNFDVITPQGNKKGVRGEIRKDQIGLPMRIPGFPYFPNPVVNFPIRFEVYIYDRALHKSNTITTPTIYVTTP